MHVGKPSKLCPVLNVHEEKMTRCEEEKYLGNILSSSGSNKANTKSRVAKGYGFAAEILSIIKEIPFGPFQIEVALKLREAMLINGSLTNSNSEVVYGLSNPEISDLQKVDEYSRGKLIHRHRFGVQMIAQMNLFRGQMIDHRKQFGGEMIALMTGTFFR